MNRKQPSRVVAAVAAAVAVLALFAAPAGAANNGDVWLTNSAASGAGHAHEPHLANGTIYLHGADLASSAGTFDIASIPGTGSGRTIWSGRAWASSNGTDVLAQFSGAALVADAISQDSAVANPNQGYHFKLTLHQGGATPSVASAQTQSGDTKTKTFWVNGDEAAPSPSLAITKTADAPSVVSGSKVGFTITVGPSAGGFANDVSVADPLPSGAGIDWSINPAYAGQGSCSILGSAPSQTLACAIGDLEGTSVSVHIESQTVAGTTAALAPLTLANTACASFDLGEDPAGEDQPLAEHTTPCSSAQTVIDPAAPGLTVAKTADAALVPAGSPVGFTITVGNRGPGVALAAAVSDPLPAVGSGAWTVSPAYSGPGSCSISGSAPSQTLSCSLGNLAAGATATVHVASPTPGGSIVSLTNTATASAANQDPVHATAHTGTTLAHLTITKVADAVTATAGSPVGFTITVGNTGSGAAEGATVSDPLPGFAGASWSISPAYTGQGTCTVGGSSPNETLSCSLGTLAPGATATVHVVATTPAGLSLTLLNVATAQATNNDPVTATATTQAIDPSVLGTTITAPTSSTQVLGESFTRQPALGEVLPFTGGPSVLLYPLAALLLVSGGILLAVARRREIAATSSPAPGRAGAPRPPWRGTGASTSRPSWATSATSATFWRRRR